MTDSNEDTEETSIDNIFEPEPEVKEPEKEPEPEPESKGEEEPEAEAEEPPKDEPSDSEPPAEEKVTTGQLAALLAEREKRQAAEAKLKEFEEKSEKEPEKIPDPIDDPEGFNSSIDERIAAAELNSRLTLSRELMMEMKDDYIEKENLFMELRESDPSLTEKLRTSPNPAKFAYQTAEQHLEMQQMRDPNYKETLKEELRKEILAELKGKSLDDPPDKKTALDVPDIISAPGAGNNTLVKEGISTLEKVFEGAAL